MRVWITKYAITSGIFETEVIKSMSEFEDMISYNSYSDNKSNIEHCHKPDWHVDKESAIKRAEEMRIKKIASLKKQITKLENMKFE